MATDLEMLVAQLDADVAKYEKKMARMGVVFDQQAAKVEARNNKLVSKLNSAWSNISFTKVLGLVGGTALFDRLIESSKSLSDTALNLAKSTGVSAETIQGLGIVARKAGVDQDALTTSLAHFSAQVGQAQLRQTAFGKTMAALGVDIKNGPEAALLSFSDKINQLPKAQQAAVAQMAFGRSGVANLAWLTEGSKNIQSMIAGFRQMGLVVPTPQLQKVNEIFDHWQDIKTEALTGFMEGFSSFADNIESPAFQSAIKDFGTTIGDISGFVVTMAPHLKTLLEVFAAFNGAKGGATIGGRIGSFFGPEGTALGIGLGALAGGVAGGFGTKAVIDHYAASGGTVPGTKPGSAPAGGNLNLAGLLDPDTAARNAKMIADLNKQLDEQIQQGVTKGENAYVELVKAQNDAMLEQAKGTSAYYELSKKAIEQNAALDIEKINEAKDADLKAIEDRRLAQLASLAAQKGPNGTGGLTPAQTRAETAKINGAAAQEEVNVAATSADQIETINAKKNQALIQNDYQYQQNLQDLITLNSTLRDGINEIGVAGLTSFKAMGEAAANFLETIAQTILKLYVMQPLLDSLLGPSGTTGGGILGSALGSLFGTPLSRATSASIAANPNLFDGGGYTGSGGRYQPAGIVHKGEVVFSQDDVRRFGGAGVVEAMRRGYANGGIVGAPSVPGVRGAGRNNPVMVNIVLTNESDQKASASKSGGGPDIDVVLDQVIARNISRQGSKTYNALRGGFGLSPTLTRR